MNKFHLVTSKYNWKLLLFLFLFYFIIFSIYTYPFIFKIDTLLIGQKDAYQYPWNSYSFIKNIKNGFRTDLLFYPWGESSLMHTGTISASAVGLLSNNKLLMINLYLVFHSILAGIGAFLLAKHFRLPFIAALCIGFIFSYSPYKMARLAEHYNLAMTGFVPFFSLYFLRAFDFTKGDLLPRIKSKRYLLWAILFGLFQGLTEFVVMFHMLYFAIFVVVFSFLKKIKDKLGIIKTAIIVFLLLLGIHKAVEYFVNNQFDDKAGLWWGGYWVDFIRPDHNLFYENMLGHYLRAFGERYNQGIEATVFIGFTFLAFSIFSLLWYAIANRKQASMLLFCCICFILVAIPEPFGYKQFYSPFSFLHFIPGLNELRCPERIINYLYLTLSIFVFMQLKDFFSYIKRDKLLLFFSLLFFAGLFIEYFPSKYNFIDFFNVPQSIRVLRKQDVRAVLVYPFGVKDGYQEIGNFENEQFQFQMFHEKSQLGGYFSRVSDHTRSNYLQFQFIEDLIKAQDGSREVDVKNYTQDILELGFNKALILNKYKNETGAVFLAGSLREAGFEEELFIDGSIFTLQTSRSQ